MKVKEVMTPNAKAIWLTESLSDAAEMMWENDCGVLPIIKDGRTVIGMIITFKAITAAGTSDPKLMAHGIGQAMIATVLGLGVAIPLLFVNAALGAASNRIGQVLNAEGPALLARVTDPTASAAGLQRPHTEDASRSGDAPQIGAAFG